MAGDGGDGCCCCCCCCSSRCFTEEDMAGPEADCPASAGRGRRRPLDFATTIRRRNSCREGKSASLTQKCPLAADTPPLLLPPGGCGTARWCVEALLLLLPRKRRLDHDSTGAIAFSGGGGVDDDAAAAVHLHSSCFCCCCSTPFFLPFISSSSSSSGCCSLGSTSAAGGLDGSSMGQGACGSNICRTSTFQLSEAKRYSKSAEGSSSASLQGGGGRAAVDVLFLSSAFDKEGAALLTDAADCSRGGCGGGGVWEAYRTAEEEEAGEELSRAST